MNTISPFSTELIGKILKNSYKMLYIVQRCVRYFTIREFYSKGMLPLFSSRIILNVQCSAYIAFRFHQSLEWLFEFLKLILKQRCKSKAMISSKLSVVRTTCSHEKRYPSFCNHLLTSKRKTLAKPYYLNYNQHAKQHVLAENFVFVRNLLITIT